MAGKLKTNKSIAKRIKVTKSGKFMHKKVGNNHLLTNKDKANRWDRYGRVLSESESKRIQALIPHKTR